MQQLLWLPPLLHLRLSQHLSPAELGRTGLTRVLGPSRGSPGCLILFYCIFFADKIDVALPCFPSYSHV